ncbi:branched-chain amino acid ABC transporter permease [Amycolatopsis pithecellobii]|uniref:Branched-chain amino acid ABC transporter permease n=1 Tax=Amycolatopsis pithecellobii TaxID=664692 RepID=A0A6N7YJR3_9PSEU|nr:branched-chain amino acid ABC transporter permease [Amycolatopsis pithecellobii]MTD53155.1 branched-chain amino acid ABC transporter permease [Amycolatopsis pithecellobii]
MSSRPARARADRVWRIGKVVKITAVAALIAVLLLLPLYLPGDWLKVGTWIMTGAVGAIGLTILTGQAGQLSLAQAFFLLVGAVSYSVLTGPTTDPTYIGLGWPPLAGMIGAVLISGLAGAAFAPVSGRLRGIYLGVASLALVFLGFWLGRALPSIAGSTSSGRPPTPFSVFGLSVDVPRQLSEITIAGVPLGRDERSWYLFLFLTVVAYLLAQGAVRGRPGRAWRAVRDHETAATVLGVSVVRTKASVFAISSAYAGLAGVMTAWWTGITKPDESEVVGTYSVTVSIAFLAMIVVGGMGSLPGAVLGAVVVFGLPVALPLVTQGGSGTIGSGTAFTPIVITNLTFGALIILIILFEPRGLAGLGRRLGLRLPGRAPGEQPTGRAGRRRVTDRAATRQA